MRLVVQDIDPAPMVQCAAKTAGRKPAASVTVKVYPVEIGLLQKDGRWRVVTDEVIQSVTLESQDTLLCVPREAEILLHCTEFAFANSERPCGDMELWAPVRFLGTISECTTLLSRLEAADETSLLRALACGLLRALEGPLTARLGTLDYARQAETRITAALSEVLTADEVVCGLKRHAGLVFVEPPRVRRVQEPWLDLAYLKERERARKSRPERWEPALPLNGAHQAGPSADNARTNALIETLLSKSSLLEARLDSALRQLQEWKVSGGSGADGFALSAVWRAYNENGSRILPILGHVSTLPSGTLLDVAVLVNRDAYVYVVVRESSGQWRLLVPDAHGLMGIERDHRQRGGIAVVWPGVNRRVPDLPFWMLHGQAGLERVYVIASAERIDLDVFHREDAMERLIAEARPLGRAEGLSAYTEREGESGVDHITFPDALLGKDRIVHETLIRHVFRGVRGAPSESGTPAGSREGGAEKTERNRQSRATNPVKRRSGA
ncbi:MAG: DUF4384 domain-containing protein [Candidatus Hydrogenedentes bacterium]|nr:DUF4384 domain-containing protein [Candidatus Hydrogenedentota bacterium]